MARMLARRPFWSRRNWNRVVTSSGLRCTWLTRPVFPSRLTTADGQEAGCYLVPAGRRRSRPGWDGREDGTMISEEMEYWCGSREASLNCR